MAFSVTTNFTNGTVADADEVNQNFADVENVINSGPTATFGISPIGSIVSWLKTFTTKDTGTANSNVLNKLVDTGATFQTTGITSGMVVQNTTDGTYAIVDVVESETTILLRADVQEGSSTIDIFPLGTENYEIYKTSELPDNWVQCNGQTLSDAASPYNGDTIPDLNADAGTARFLRGSVSSGATGGTEVHKHGVTVSLPPAHNIQGAGAVDIAVETNDTSTLPSYYEVVWIMRVK